MYHMYPPVTELGALLSGLYIKPMSLKDLAVLKLQSGNVYEVWVHVDSGRGQSGGSGWISVVDSALVREAIERGYLREVTNNEEPYFEKPDNSLWYAITKDQVKIAKIIPIIEAWEEKEYSSQQDV